MAVLKESLARLHDTLALNPLENVITVLHVTDCVTFKDATNNLKLRMRVKISAHYIDDRVQDRTGFK